MGSLFKTLRVLWVVINFFCSHKRKVHNISYVQVVNPVPTSWGTSGSRFLTFWEEMMANTKSIAYIDLKTFWITRVYKVIYFVFWLKLKLERRWHLIFFIKSQRMIVVSTWMIRLCSSSIVTLPNEPLKLLDFWYDFIQYWIGLHYYSLQDCNLFLDIVCFINWRVFG